MLVAGPVCPVAGAEVVEPTTPANRVMIPVSISITLTLPGDRSATYIKPVEE
jgi:hypothetical protein